MFCTMEVLGNCRPFSPWPPKWSIWRSPCCGHCRPLLSRNQPWNACSKKCLFLACFADYILECPQPGNEVLVYQYKTQQHLAVHLLVNIDAPFIENQRRTSPRPEPLQMLSGGGDSLFKIIVVLALQPNTVILFVDVLHFSNEKTMSNPAQIITP